MSEFAICEVSKPGAAVELDDLQMRHLVRDLHRVKAPIYWSDFLFSALLGWSAFYLAIVLRPFSWGMLSATAIATAGLYRALCFMHEISHQNQRTLTHFEGVWNLLAGYPLLMPSFVYVGVHNDHHKLTSYGTAEDPEYLPFARSHRMTILFVAQSLLIPAFLLVRFVLLTPIGFLVPRFQKWLVVHASSVSMNVRYRRAAPQNLIDRVRRHGAASLVLWAIGAGLLVAGVLPWRTLAVWYVICATASLVNTLRTLGAHAYESAGQPLDRIGQLLDSIDTPGRFWTELWAPVGLRYHAVHHYFPGIPYHNLPEAYRRLADTVPFAAAYRKMSSPSLPHSLKALYLKGMRRLKETGAGCRAERRA